jgi:hypothetical protein
LKKRTKKLLAVLTLIDKSFLLLFFKKEDLSFSFATGLQRVFVAVVAIILLWRQRAADLSGG